MTIRELYIMKRVIGFPSKNEYPAYAEMYMKLVNRDGSLLKQLEDSLEKTKSMVALLSEDELDFRYQEDKWSVKEVLVHIIDDERIYVYRALAFARNEKTSLPGFEQDDYNKYSDTLEREIQNIMAEYQAVRMSTITLFSGLSDRALIRKGYADGNETSVRALGYHILGHELHHIKIIKEVYL